MTALFIEPGSAREQGYVEGFNGTLRDALLNGEMFCSLGVARANRAMTGGVQPRPAALQPRGPPPGSEVIAARGLSVPLRAGQKRRSRFEDSS